MEKKKIRWSKEKVLELFENYEIRNVTDFQKMFSGACNYSYRNNMLDELPFKDRNVVRTSSKKTKNLTLKPALVEHFKNWAKAEGTSVEKQARKYSFHSQYVEYCQQNELDLETGVKFENIRIKIKNI